MVIILIVGQLHNDETQGQIKQVSLDFNTDVGKCAKKISLA